MFVVSLRKYCNLLSRLSYPLQSLEDSYNNNIIKLNSNNILPIIGLGTWHLLGDNAINTVYNAINIGYKHIDTAPRYNNEKEIGLGIEKSGIKRNKLFITTKLGMNNHKYSQVLPSLKKSLIELNMDYVDLFLIHFPMDIGNSSSSLPKVSLYETWSAMENIKNLGLAKDIGLCNTSGILLHDLLTQCTIIPAVNQIERHPFLVQENLVKYCQARNITVISYSSLGSPSYSNSYSLLNNKTIIEISKILNKTPGQILLKWSIQQKTAIIPKSQNIDRLQENISLFNWNIPNDYMDKITKLNCNHRFLYERHLELANGVPIYN